MSSLHWGIDLGGTKIEGLVTASLTDHTAVICRERIPTEGERGYRHVLGQISKLLQRMVEITGHKPQRIGFGTPGTLDPSSNLMRGCNSRHLNDQALAADLEQQLGVPVRIANDANCFALAETRFGATRQWLNSPEPIFGGILGTGVGGGLVIDGQAVYGRHGIAGEWGHTHLDDSGGTCWCGRTGCVETILSGPSLEAFYTGITGEKQALAEIDTLADGGHEAASRTMDRLLDFLALGLSRIVNIVDPAAIVIGGGVGNLARIYDEVPGRMAAHAFTPTLTTPIVRPELGDSAGVFGAACLWQETG